MKQKKPSEEYLDFLRSNKEDIEEFHTIKNYLSEKLKEHIEYHIEAGFTYKEIEESFKGISFLKKQV